MKLSYEKFLKKLGLVDSTLAKICYEFYCDAFADENQHK